MLVRGLQVSVVLVAMSSRLAGRGCCRDRSTNQLCVPDACTAPVQSCGAGVRQCTGLLPLQAYPARCGRRERCCYWGRHTGTEGTRAGGGCGEGRPAADGELQHGLGGMHGGAAASLGSALAGPSATQVNALQRPP